VRAVSTKLLAGFISLFSLFTASVAAAAPDEEEQPAPAADVGPGPQAITPIPPPAEPTPTTTPTKDAFVFAPRFRRFDTAEYVLTGIVAVSAGALHGFGSPHRDDPVLGPILFDDAVRDGLRAKGKDDLNRVRMVGDVLTVVPIINAIAIDGLLVPALRRNADAAWQMTWMSAQAFGTSGLVTWMLFNVVGRGRPSYRECHARTTDDPLCFAGETSSFPSGHTAASFVGAGLIFLSMAAASRTASRAQRPSHSPRAPASSA